MREMKYVMNICGQNKQNGTKYGGEFVHLFVQIAIFAPKIKFIHFKNAEDVNLCFLIFCL